MPEFFEVEISGQLAEVIIYNLQEELNHGDLEQTGEAENLIHALLNGHRVTLFIKSE